MLFSLYFRPWVLNRAFANPRVPHLDKLDLVLVPRWDSSETTLQGAIPRRRRHGKQNVLTEAMGSRDWDYRKYSFDESWRRYVRGNIVSEHAERLIWNTLQIALGSGKQDRDEEDMVGTSHRRREDFGDGGRRMTVEEVGTLLAPEKRLESERDSGELEAKKDSEDAKARHRNYIAERIDKDFEMLNHLDGLIEKAVQTGSDATV
jgi:hypothetical protein